VVRLDGVTLVMFTWHTLWDGEFTIIRLGTPRKRKIWRDILGQPDNVFCTRVTLSKSTIVLECKCHTESNRKHICGSRWANPHTHGMIRVCNLVPLGPTLGSRWIPVFRNSRNVPRSVQHLNNFKKNFYNMLITVQLGTLLNIEGKKEDVHFLRQGFRPQITFSCFLTWVNLRHKNLGKK